MRNKKSFSGRFTAFAAAAGMLISSGIFSSSDIQVIQASDKCYNGKTPDDYDYELWNQDNQGTVDMQLTGSNGGFICSWKDVKNCLFHTGKKLGSTKHYTDYLGPINLSYEVDFKPGGSSFLSVYGWTEQPTVEYYIVEAWGDWRPPGISDSKFKIYSNEKEYDVYTITRIDQPSIHGTETFEQYWSVNTVNPAAVNATRNIKGNVTLSDHFKAWEKEGMEVGYLYEISLSIEAYNSSGSANVKRNGLFSWISPDAEEPFTTDIIITQPPVVTSPAVTSPLPDETAVSGDVDGNGSLNTLDIIKLIQHMIGTELLAPDQIKASDMNCDGKISVIDLIMLKNKLI